MSFQTLNFFACVLGFMASLAMSEQFEKRQIWQGRVAYLVVAGAYLCNAWNMLATQYPRVPWTAVFVHGANAIVLTGFAWYLNRHESF
jgi:hypothetical protein